MDEFHIINVPIIFKSNSKIRVKINWFWRRHRRKYRLAPFYGSAVMYTCIFCKF